MTSLRCANVLGLSSGVGPLQSQLSAGRFVLSAPFRTEVGHGPQLFSKFCSNGSAKTEARRSLVRAEGPEGGASGDSEDSLDVSVFRFTLGIPGLDDSELPRILGIVFGGLLILNHAFTLNTMTGAQLFSEGVGLVLAGVSISLPAIGAQLNGAQKKRQSFEPGQKQIFCLADGLTTCQRQNIAWASYSLLKNTSTTAVLVCHSNRVVGARGLFGDQKDSGSVSIQPLECLQQRLDTKLEDFLKLKEPLYLSVNADAQAWNIVPRGTASMLVQPFPTTQDNVGEGFLLLMSSTPRAYRIKDRKWAAYLAVKLSGVLYP